MDVTVSQFVTDDTTISSLITTTTADGDGDTDVVVETIRNISFVLIVFLSALGVVTNAMNMVVFKKLFSGNPINLNLFALAVSDFGVCFTTLCLVALANNWSAEYFVLRYSIFPVEVFSMTFGVLHTLFVRITLWLTVMIAFDRCLCVVKSPLKARSIITYKTVVRYVITCFLVLGAVCAIPFYYVNRLEWVFYPFVNTTYLRRVPTENFHSVNEWFIPLETFVLQLFPYAIILVCTVAMLIRLRKRSDRRCSAICTTSTNAQEIETATAKEYRVVRMITILLFKCLICYVYNVIIFLVNLFAPDYDINIFSDKQIYQLLGSVALALDSLIASVNLFIYYKNSTRYKQTYRVLFCQARQKTDTKAVQMTGKEHT